MTAYNVFFAGLDLALHGRDPFGRDSSDQSEDGAAGGWRPGVTVTIAIVLWLLMWLGGWWVSRVLSSGSFVWTTAGACVGWLLGLGIATVFLYFDERL